MAGKAKVCRVETDGYITVLEEKQWKRYFGSLEGFSATSQIIILQLHDEGTGRVLLRSLEIAEDQVVEMVKDKMSSVIQLHSLNKKKKSKGLQLKGDDPQETTRWFEAIKRAQDDLRAIQRPMAESARLDPERFQELAQKCLAGTGQTVQYIGCTQ